MSDHPIPFPDFSAPTASDPASAPSQYDIQITQSSERSRGAISYVASPTELISPEVWREFRGIESAETANKAPVSELKLTSAPGRLSGSFTTALRSGTATMVGLWERGL